MDVDERTAADPPRFVGDKERSSLRFGWEEGLLIEAAEYIMPLNTHFQRRQANEEFNGYLVELSVGRSTKV